LSRQVTLNAVRAGMTRLRDKGGANPESLYELTNGYVTASRTIKSRPGCTLAATLPAGTKGIAVYNGQLVTFCHEPVTVPSGWRLEIVRHPVTPDLALRAIHFAAPHLGFLYVVAEFEGGDVYHFWLQALRPWTAGTVVRPGDTMSPNTPNGYIYEATRSDQPAALWAPNVDRALNDVVEPTTANGYRYRVIEVFGQRPASGAFEPGWIATRGARVIESTDIPQETTQPVQQTPASSDGGAADALADRYFGLSIGRRRQR
jgi:hypothetical protein